MFIWTFWQWLPHIDGVPSASYTNSFLIIRTKKSWFVIKEFVAEWLVCEDEEEGWFRYYIVNRIGSMWVCVCVAHWSNMRKCFFFVMCILLLWWCGWKWTGNYAWEMANLDELVVDAMSYLFIAKWYWRTGRRFLIEGYDREVDFRLKFVF